MTARIATGGRKNPRISETEIRDLTHSFSKLQLRNCYVSNLEIKLEEKLQRSNFLKL